MHFGPISGSFSSFFEPLWSFFEELSLSLFSQIVLRIQVWGVKTCIPSVFSIAGGYILTQTRHAQQPNHVYLNLDPGVNQTQASTVTVLFVLGILSEPFSYKAWIVW